MTMPACLPFYFSLVFLLSLGCDQGQSQRANDSFDEAENLSRQAEKETHQLDDGSRYEGNLFLVCPKDMEQEHCQMEMFIRANS